MSVNAPYEKSIDPPDIGYHQQEHEWYCGPACAQMSLHAAPISFVLTNIGQYGLKQKIDHSGNSNFPGYSLIWASTPHGLTNALRQVSGNYSNTFDLIACASEEEATALIIWNIEHYHRPAIALVYEYKHWIIVHGFGADRAPRSADDRVNLVYLDIYDPYPARPSSDNRPPPHRDRDVTKAGDKGDACGDNASRGVEAKRVLYSTWQNEIMTLLPPPGQWPQTCWPCQCLVIIERDRNDRAPAATSCAPDECPDTSHIGLQQERLQSCLAARSGALISLAEARRRAVEGLNNYASTGGTVWPNLQNVRNDDEPYTVEYLEFPGIYYYIVPIRYEETTPIAVRIDAYSGEFMEAIASPNVKSDALGITPWLQIRDQLPAGWVHMVDGVPDATVPRLVWMPCAESLSPFYPFYLFTPADGSSQVFIRALDGQRSEKLTVDIAGA